MAYGGSKITPAHFTELKALVKTEMTRRGKTEGTAQNTSKGTLSTYAGTSYDYSTVPAAETKILLEHITKISQPVDAAAGTSYTPGSNASITGTMLDNIASKLSSLTATDATSSSHGCKSNCSGLCSSGCYSACSGCSNTCTGSCKGGCSGCSGSCTGSCTSCSGCSGCSGCWDTCKNSGCTGSCSNTCTGGCDCYCSGTNVSWWNGKQC